MCCLGFYSTLLILTLPASPGGTWLNFSRHTPGVARVCTIQQTAGANIYFPERDLEKPRKVSVPPCLKHTHSVVPVAPDQCTTQSIKATAGDLLSMQFFCHICEIPLHISTAIDKSIPPLSQTSQYLWQDYYKLVKSFNSATFGALPCSQCAQPESATRLG